ncbi:MAG: dTMP kinase [Verrucomicrobiota bacterium]
MKTPIPGGLLVAVEGIDGAGKTTVAGMLAQWCGERGLACVFSKEPTSLTYGQKLRESAKTGRLSIEEELELFRLDRKEHVERSIGPALAENQIVILDRYYWSNAAYQGARGVDPGRIVADNEGIAPIPDLYLFLDVEVGSGIGRIRGRGDAPNDFEGHESLEQARAIFTALHERGDRPSVRIDASRDLRAVCADALRVFKETALRKILASNPVLLAQSGGLFDSN